VTLIFYARIFYVNDEIKKIFTSDNFLNLPPDPPLLPALAAP
jgi:hypothetical protein